MQALIDGDLIVYSVGFAVDVRYYEVDSRIFKYKKEAATYCEFHELDKEEITLRQFPGSLHMAVKTIDHLLDKIQKGAGCDTRKVYLTGSGNHRDAIAVTHKYKGNREGTEKPFHYNEIRAYLINVHTAIVVDGMEADDALGLAQTEGTVICSKDKDLNTIPGKHYNWDKYDDGVCTITADEASIYYYEQVLTGDVTDNIIGLKGVGPKTASKMLANCSTAMERHQVCKREYELRLIFDRLIENMRLLSILGGNHLDILEET